MKGVIITVALYIILGIIALFAIILNVRIRINIDMADELSLNVSVFGIKIGILPKKEKKYKISNYTLKKIAKRDRKKAEKEAKRAEAAKKKAAQKKHKDDEKSKLTKKERRAQRKEKMESLPPIPDMISLLIDTLKFFFPSILTKFHFHVARIRLKIGGKDAAQTVMLYTLISNAMAATLCFIDEHSNLHGAQRAEIDISPDFLSEEIKADVKLGFSTSIGGVLATFIRSGFKLLFGFVKIKPSGTSKSKASTITNQVQNSSPAKAENEKSKATA